MPSQTSTIPWVCYRRRNQWLRLALALFCLPLIWLARIVYLLVVVAGGWGGRRGHAYSTTVVPSWTSSKAIYKKKQQNLKKVQNVLALKLRRSCKAVPGNKYLYRPFTLLLFYFYVKGRERLYERRFRSAKTQKHICSSSAPRGSRAHITHHHFSMSHDHKFNQFKFFGNRSKMSGGNQGQ